MAKFTPQEELFKKLNFIEKWKTGCFIVSIIGTIILPILKNSNILNVIFSVFFLIILSSLDVWSESCRNNAEKTRRCDLFDNSFGTKYNTNYSIEYYSNDDISLGIYKTLVNIFQNCFWSFEISKKMKESELIKTILFSIIIIIFAIIGFSNNVFSIPMLQLFLSKEILIKYINIYIYNKELEIIFEDLKKLFSDKLLKENPEQKIGEMIYIITKYECNISNYKLDLNSKIFEKENDILEKKWIEIKKRYEII